MTMKVLWVLAHPEARSLNGSLRDFGVRTLAAAGHEVRQSDLYRMGWKAVADGNDFTDSDPAVPLNYAAASYRGFRNGTQASDVVAEQEREQRHRGLHDPGHAGGDVLLAPGDEPERERGVEQPEDDRRPPALA